MNRLRSIAESMSSDLIDLGDIDSYNAEKIGSDGEYDFYTYDESRHHSLLMTVGKKVIGEISFSKHADKKYGGFAVHTAHFEPDYRGQGLYKKALEFARDWLKDGIISYPFDEDSEQERSPAATKFWTKNGEVVGKMEGQHIYKLK